ncbi:hypothetical protein [Bacillus sp. OV322]|nr:hypothetical protein [Bacillus sp. OV322]
MLKLRGLILTEQTEKYAELKRKRSSPPLHLDERTLEEMQQIVMESYHE